MRPRVTILSEWQSIQHELLVVDIVKVIIAVTLIY